MRTRMLTPQRDARSKDRRRRLSLRTIKKIELGQGSCYHNPIMPRTLYAIALLFILSGTLFVLASGEPEARVLESDDGRLTITGKFLATEQFTIGAPKRALSSTAVVGPSYQLYPPDHLFSPPVTINLNYQNDVSDDDAPRLRFGYFDEAFSMWRPVYTTMDPSTHTASAEIDHTAHWALLLMDDIARPNLANSIAFLLDAAPEQAVGYQLEVGYAQVPGDFVILQGAGQSGGCGGQYKMGTSTSTTSLGNVFSDSLEYQIVVVWQLADGCSDRQSIE